MASLFKKTTTKTDPATGRTIAQRAAKWWGSYKDHLGIRRRVPLATDKNAAQAMLAELVRRAERMRVGIVDPAESEQKKPLKVHLADYRAFLEGENRDAAHVALTARRLERLFLMGRMRTLADLQPARFVATLADLRREGVSTSTSNGYLRAARAFCWWLARDRRIP